MIYKTQHSCWSFRWPDIIVRGAHSFGLPVSITWVAIISVYFARGVNIQEYMLNSSIRQEYTVPVPVTIVISVVQMFSSLMYV